MTLWAQKTPSGQVKVCCTYGPITFDVTEDISHVRVFWAELGRVLEQEDAAKASGQEG